MSQTYLLSRKERKNRCVQGLLYIKTIMSKLLLKIKNVPIYGLIQPKLKKVSKNEWKPLEKPACIFFKVHWSSFVTRFYCIKPTHLSVLRFSGSFDTHYKGRILPQFYIQLVHFWIWILLFLAVWAAQGTMEKIESILATF